MFTSLIQSPLTSLTLSAKAHNMLNATMIDEIVQTMRTHDWNCNTCGTRMPEMMEVDHLKGHKPAGKDALAPICQFCHDRKHLLWAASRKRVTLIHAPDLSYEELSQISWAMVTHKEREGFTIDAKKLQRDLSSRQEDAFDAIGHTNLEAIFEAIYALRDAKGEEAVLARLTEMDAHIKIAPAAIFMDQPVIEGWARGGFRAVEEGWQERVIPEKFPSYAALRSAGDALKARL
ncbi:HNH endonuclease signature motif containing protein [Sulfitobacter sp. 1A13353]|uniref:HNH endonuclease signature motif containing protein n=1 Tax=Sulfitobacter sp. 1A13353 TaxID=3368568 RepID=UPI00374666AB